MIERLKAKSLPLPLSKCKCLIDTLITAHQTYLHLGIQLHLLGNERLQRSWLAGTLLIGYITALFPQSEEPPPATQAFCLCWKKFNDLRNVHKFTAQQRGHSRSNRGSILFSKTVILNPEYVSCMIFLGKASP